jgi:hypothetical protein
MVERAAISVREDPVRLLTNLHFTEEEENTQCLASGKGVVGNAASGGARDLLLLEDLVRVQGLLV